MLLVRILICCCFFERLNSTVTRPAVKGQTRASAPKKDAMTADTTVFLICAGKPPDYSAIFTIAVTCSSNLFSCCLTVYPHWVVSLSVKKENMDLQFGVSATLKRMMYVLASTDMYSGPLLEKGPFSLHGGFY